LRFLTPSWDEIYAKTTALAKKIRKNENARFDVIVGVSRGGMVPARILSDLLEVPNLLVTRCEYYVDYHQRSKTPSVTQKIQEDVGGKRVLVVDDVADSGDSLKSVKEYIKSKRPKAVKFATIYVKPHSKEIPDYWAQETTAWIIFPWEYHEALKSLSTGKIEGSLRELGIPAKYARIICKMDPYLRGVFNG
jgi:uncharacterized protein